MTSTNLPSLLIVWILVMAFSLIAIIAILIWAVRSRQFSNQDRARYLPLDEGIPELDETEDEQTKQEKKGK